jgi:hypothetical protein
VAALRGQLFYLCAVALASLLLHATSRAAADPNCCAGREWARVPPSLK